MFYPPREILGINVWMNFINFYENSITPSLTFFFKKLMNFLYLITAFAFN